MLSVVLCAVAAARPCRPAAPRVPACRLPAVAMAESDGPQRSRDAGRLELSGSDSGLENINRAGPSEARINELRSKVEKLRGMNAAILEGEALLNPKKAAKPRTVVPSPQTPPPGGAGADVGEPAAAAAPPAAGVDQPAAATAPPGARARAAAGQTSSSIGGTWVRPAAAETYVPSGSGSWGLFERPLDISSAMGGGKRVGVGAPPAETAEERAAKDRETAALLQAYKAATAAGDAYERENEQAILDALGRAKQLMRAGDVRRCARELEPVWRNCSVRSELGGRVGLELAMAYDAAQERVAAGELYEQLLSSSSVQVRRLAKQLKFGLEAMERLGFEGEADMSAISGYAAMPELQLDNRYEQSYGGMLAELPISDGAEAVAELYRAASNPALQCWTDERVRAALALLREPANRDLRAGAALTGVWRLVLQVGPRGRVSADGRLRQIISPSADAAELRVSRLCGAGPFVAELEGAMRELPSPAGLAATGGEARPAQEQPRGDEPDGPRGELPPYELRFESYRLGPLLLGGGAPALATVLVLDDSLLVTMEQEPGAREGAPASFFVWAQ